MRALFLLSILLAAGTVYARPNPYLAQAKVFYQGLEFEKCLQRLDQAARWKNTPQESVDVELYSGLCKYNLGRAKDAADHFELAVKLKPTAALPPYTSPKIQAVFDEVKQRVAPAPPVEAPKDAVATADAPTKTELTPAPKVEEPLDASLREPETSGSGRSYVAPIALGGAAVIAAGLGGYMGLQAKSFESQANAARFESDALALGAQAQQNATFANVGFGVAVAAATGAVVTFLLSGGDEAE